MSQSSLRRKAIEKLLTQKHRASTRAKLEDEYRKLTKGSK